MNFNGVSAFYNKVRGFSFNKDEFKKENPIQIGYIYLPEGENKINFEKECRRTGTYAIMLESGTIKQRCHYLDDKPLMIPENSKYVGETVLVVFPDSSDIPLIIKKITDNSTTHDNMDEVSKSKTSFNENTAIKVTEDITNRIYSVSISSDEDKDVTLNLNVSAKNKKGKLKINVNGDCEIFAEKNVNVLANNEVDIKIRDLVKGNKFHEIKYNIDSGLTLKDKWDNTINLNQEEFNVNIKKKAIVNAENIKITASDKIIIDAPGNKKIEIGNASSMALNDETICCFTGMKHFIPLTNVKTKV